MPPPAGDFRSPEMCIIFVQLVELDPKNASSQAAVRRLKPIVEERREKMKNEMIGPHFHFHTADFSLPNYWCCSLESTTEPEVDID